MSQHNKIEITTDSGEKVEALAPVIISASRATDIPAFYAPWLLHRLEKGYLAWKNPFNQKKSYVSFEKTRVIVFWTKNPKPLMDCGGLEELDDRGIHYYFQFTLNDYEAEGFEPKVEPLEKRVETFRALSEKIGPERVIWRFDPMILGFGLTPEILVGRVRNIGERIRGCTNKLVFSFIDLYRKVKTNMGAIAEIDGKQRQEIVDRLLALRETWRREGWTVALLTCAENGEYPGVAHNHCIDGALIRECFGKEDQQLMDYLEKDAQQENKRQTRQQDKWMQQSLFGEAEVPDTTERSKVVRIYTKDPGQRAECGCDVSKDIGQYHTCPHGCRYCYANESPEKARENYKRHARAEKSGKHGECLIPDGT
jgi:DNA repair photolyase